MSGRIVVLVATVVVITLAGLDYGATVKAQAGQKPPGMAEHVMNRLSQAKAALGLAPPPKDVPAAAAGPATALIEARLAEAQAAPQDKADSGDARPAAAAVEKPRREMTRKERAREKARKKGAITIGKGTCATRGGAGKFCSPGAE